VFSQESLKAQNLWIVLDVWDRDSRTDDSGEYVAVLERIEEFLKCIDYLLNGIEQVRALEFDEKRIVLLAVNE